MNKCMREGMNEGRNKRTREGMDEGRTELMK